MTISVRVSGYSYNSTWTLWPESRYADLEQLLRNEIPGFSVYGGSYSLKWSIPASYVERAIEISRSWAHVVSNNTDYPAPAWQEGMSRPLTLDEDLALEAIAPLFSPDSRGTEEEILNKALRNWQGDLFRELGLFRKEVEVYGQENQIRASFDSSCRDFLMRFVERISSQVSRQLLEDRSIRETTPSMAVLLQEWESCREQRFRSPPRYQGEKFYPCWGEAWVKAAVLGLGSTFRLQEDGTFARTLHPWLLQVPGPVTNINVFGKTQHVASWAILPGAVIGEKHGEIMHISLVGNVTSLRAFHAAFMDSKRSVFSFPRYGNYGSAITAQREKGSSRYLTVFNDEELPKSGMAHLDISHISITKPPFAESFIHLVGNVKDAPPDLLLFFRQLNAAISIAVREEWSQKLWDYGISYRLIQSIPSMGCTAWVVWPNEQKWGRIVSALVLGKDPEDVYDETLFEAVGNASPDDDMDMVIEDEEQDDNEED